MMTPQTIVVLTNLLECVVDLFLVALDLYF